ncbi:MAG: hypothetical protein ThorAB25_28110 [Candidatus Thorarchaeota archaeon AB_25]|nr:MAG: hypothetical protein ThorAB25_28110 [Candidatus Thorarchaeota archaeon AB_25]
MKGTVLRILQCFFLLTLVVSLFMLSGTLSLGFQRTTQNISNTNFMEYEVNCSIIVLWNYTMNDEDVISYPGDVIYDVGTFSQILIKIMLSSTVDRDWISSVIQYQVYSQLEYNLSYQVSGQYSLTTGDYTPEEDSFVGQLLVFRLFDSGGLSTDSVMSSLGTLSVTGEYMGMTEWKYQDENWQNVRRYNCEFNHIVDGEVSHTRYYDEDSGLLLWARGGISDYVLLGLVNISYVVGELALIDTSIDLGLSHANPVLFSPPLVGIGALVVFLACYVTVYRIQRPSSSGGKMKHRRRRIPKGRKRG